MSNDATKETADESYDFIVEQIKAKNYELNYDQNGQIKEIVTENSRGETIRLGIIDPIKKIIEQSGLKLVQEEGDGKRIYRKRSDLPDPSLPADAEVNRLREVFKVRVLPGLKEEVDAAAKAEGLTRQAWVERALRLALDQTNE